VILRLSSLWKRREIRRTSIARYGKSPASSADLKLKNVALLQKNSEAVHDKRHGTII
jgi:hypothetical protein